MLKLVANSLLISGLLMVPANAQDVKFGNDSSEYANDGECDDRRFFGFGMATGLDRDDMFKDATDCRNAYRDGRIRVWVQSKAKAATQCSAIRFGNNSSEWARDGECDDYRLEGPGTSKVMNSEDIGRDAADCRRLCEQGKVFVREY